MATNTREVLAKTADYTVTGADEGALITNRGAGGAVVVTLPAQSAVPVGFWVQVYCAAAQNLTVQTATVDTLVQDGDLNTDSIGWVTGSHQVGNGGTFVADGTGWLYFANVAATTTTIATQTLTT